MLKPELEAPVILGNPCRLLADMFHLLIRLCLAADRNTYQLKCQRVCTTYECIAVTGLIAMPCCSWSNTQNEVYRTQLNLPLRV